MSAAMGMKQKGGNRQIEETGYTKHENIYQSKRQGIFYTGITSILKTTYPT